MVVVACCIDYITYLNMGNRVFNKLLFPPFKIRPIENLADELLPTNCRHW